MPKSHVSNYSLAIALAVSAPLSAAAQEAPPSRAPTAVGDAGVADIIVTARKRGETLIAVPVVISAVSSADIERRSIVNLDSVSRIVPQLLIAPASGSIQGGALSMRGISGPDSNPFGDQAVAFNIDGVQIAKSFVRRMSEMDIDQIEVLKGPQALFFGKNSPGGIVSIRTADPTSHWQGRARVGYEFYAHEIRGEGYVSGPISDTLGIRIGGSASKMRGYLKEATPDNVYLNPNYDHSPRNRDFALRGTLKYEPSDAFNARLKLNYAQLKTNGPNPEKAYIFCPLGTPQYGTVDDCKANGNSGNAAMGPGLNVFRKFIDSTGSRFPEDGQNYLKQRQFLGGLELNYNISDAVTLTSVTGLYWVDVDMAGNFTDYVVAIASAPGAEDKEFSQEFRVTTDYDGPLNFTAGVYYSKTNADTESQTYVFAAEPSGRAIFISPTLPFAALPYRTPVQLNNYYLSQKGTAYSAFLQMRYNPVETVEIAVGGRYSQEKKRLPTILSSGSAFGQVFSGGTAPFGIPIDPNNPAHIIDPASSKGSWNDFSPEVTLSYRPNSDLTMFGSYKHGFLSGGFNSSSTTLVDGVDLSYDPQTIKGFEAGVKAALLDRKLFLNIAAYTYKVSDLQVTNYFNTVSSITNAGGVKIKGMEADLTYATPLPGLTLNTAIAYNKGSYSSYPNAPCYVGQLAAQGCNIATGSQDLKGTELQRAPKWNLTGGLNYETLLSGQWKFGMSVDAKYSSSYLTDATSSPAGRMPKYALLDASLRMGQADNAWEVALIGRNLTNKYYWVSSTDQPFTGGARDSGNFADRTAALSRGREIVLRLTYNFGQ